MVKRERGPLRRFLVDNGIGQNALADGIHKSSGYLSQLANDDTGASHDTIDAILLWLSAFLGRKVTYEEVFQGRQAIGRAMAQSIRKRADQAVARAARRAIRRAARDAKKNRAEANR